MGHRHVYCAPGEDTANPRVTVLQAELGEWVTGLLLTRTAHSSVSGSGLLFLKHHLNSFLYLLECIIIPIFQVRKRGLKGFTQIPVATKPGARSI